MSAAAHTFDKRQRSSRRVGSGHTEGLDGYTLLELLIASVMMLVLMAALWTLLGNYSGLYEKGQERTERSQLVRSLAQQLADDLRAVVVADDFPASPARLLPPNEPPAAGFGSSPQHATIDASGMVGSPDVLLLDIATAVAPGDIVADQEELDETIHEDPTLQPRSLAPELLRVEYRFHDRTLADIEPSSAGLVRRWWSWKQLQSGRWLPREDSYVGAGDDAGDLAEADSFPIDPAPKRDVSEGREVVSDDHSDRIPEIVRLRFRYFDGQAWRDDWDSRLEHSLPVAVELLFDLGDRLVQDEIESPEEISVSPRDYNGQGLKTRKSSIAESAADLVVVKDDEPEGRGWSPEHRWLLFLRPPDPPADDQADTLSAMSSSELPRSEYTEPLP